MTNWICQHCTNVIRERSRAPACCSWCGHGDFQVEENGAGAFSDGMKQLPADSPPPGMVCPVALPEMQLRLFTLASGAPSRPRGERRRARRVRPKEHLEVRLCHIAPLQAVDISAIGLLIEHTSPFRPGLVCEVELRRSSRKVRLRGEVVRTFVSASRGSRGGVRYRSALQFLETPSALFDLLPELLEESAREPVRTPAPD
jgi:hypothetical protein